MREEIEKLVTEGKIKPDQLDPLNQLIEAGYCMHRSWGFGRITTVDTILSRLTIDFQSKPGHSMDLGFATQSLDPIPASHILARKASDLASIKQMAVVNPLELIKLALQSYGRQASVEQIQKSLTPDVIEEDWKKWWDNVKREMKKSGHFKMPLKKSAPIVYHDEEVTLKKRLTTEFRAAKGLKTRLTVASEVLKSVVDINGPAELAQEMIEQLNLDIASHRGTQPAIALEAIFTRADLREACELEQPNEGEVQAGEIWSEISEPLNELLEKFPAGKYRKALQSFKEHTPDWPDYLEKIINLTPQKLVSECANIFINDEKLDYLKTILKRYIKQQGASSEMLLWLVKEKTDRFSNLLGPQVFRAILTAMEQDQLHERRSNRLGDYMLSDKKLILTLLDSADIETVKDLTRALQFSSCFEDVDKRSLLARIVKAYPAVQSLISGDQKREDESILVSWKSLERRRGELDELIKKKIPENSKEIAIARSYGDLRENHEYKAAKEMQKVLMRQREEMEAQLNIAKGTEFRNLPEDRVAVGSRVHLTNLDSQQKETYSILGAWDTDAEERIISYLSPLGKAMLNREVGDEVTFETESGDKVYRIDAFEPHFEDSDEEDR